MNIWLTADTHFGHANIIKYCKRPFKDLNGMNAGLIKKWNEKVNPGDTVVVLGDFAWEKRYDEIKQKYLEKLNGNILFVKGNHDRIRYTSRHENLIIKNGETEIFCTHNPVDVDTSYNINFVGHVHDLWKTKEVVCNGRTTKLVNVGVDVNNFQPISLVEALS